MRPDVETDQYAAYTEVIVHPTHPHGLRSSHPLAPDQLHRDGYDGDTPPTSTRNNLLSRYVNSWICVTSPTGFIGVPDSDGLAGPVRRITDLPPIGGAGMSTRCANAGPTDESPVRDRRIEPTPSSDDWAAHRPPVSSPTGGSSPNRRLAQRFWAALLDSPRFDRGSGSGASGGGVTPDGRFRVGDAVPHAVLRLALE